MRSIVCLPQKEEEEEEKGLGAKIGEREKQEEEEEEYGAPPLFPSFLPGRKKGKQGK